MLRIALLSTLLTVTPPVLANTADEAIFQKVFTDWTAAFNKKDLNKTCGLFSLTVSADYQGYPTKNYASLCEGFETIFKDTKHFDYSFKINQVYRSGDLAAVRITWKLRITDNGKLISEGQDEGMDIFQKDSLGHWKIVNYLGYGVKN